MREVRVRFAPSPTGALHIGGVRTALYNYLFAKKYSGKFILRIEDTDRKRYVQNAEDYILNSLNWLGLQSDESPEVGGESVFYRQSERLDIYDKYIKILLEAGHAYYAFDTPEELEKMRVDLTARNIASPKYDANMRLHMRNSLVLPYNEVQHLLSLNTPYVIRMKIPVNRAVRFYDQVHGWIKVDSRELEDKVLMKSDRFPTYHFANVVDDHLMRISHVIRGEEWLPSTPIHILLYDFFNWTDTMPEFVHLPLILNSSGKGKLSKRDGINMNFPIFPLSWNVEDTEVKGFKERGFLPAAVLNFLALMGWNPGIKKEVFTLSELITAFSLERIGKSGTKFDIDKAKWLNQQHLRLLDKNYVCQYIKGFIKRDGIEFNENKTHELYNLLLDRAFFLEDVIFEAKSILLSPIYDKAYYSGVISEVNKNIIIHLANELDKLELYNKENLKIIVENIASRFNFSKGTIMSSIRQFITGKRTGPDLLTILVILEKKEVISRLKNLLSLFC